MKSKISNLNLCNIFISHLCSIIYLPETFSCDIKTQKLYLRDRFTLKIWYHGKTFRENVFVEYKFRVCSVIKKIEVNKSHRYKFMIFCVIKKISVNTSHGYKFGIFYMGIIWNFFVVFFPEAKEQFKTHMLYAHPHRTFRDHFCLFAFL